MIKPFIQDSMNIPIHCFFLHSAVYCLIENNFSSELNKSQKYKRIIILTLKKTVNLEIIIRLMELRVLQNDFPTLSDQLFDYKQTDQNCTVLDERYSLTKDNECVCVCDSNSDQTLWYILTRFFSQFFELNFFVKSRAKWMNPF